MNEAIIERWNSVVKKHDKVYHLGDFAFGRHNVGLASRLNGQKRLIMGNHDAYPVEMYAKYFLSVHAVMYWRDCLLTHVPVHTSQLCSRAKYNIHGHLHSKRVMYDPHQPWARVDERYINVSCEHNNLTPINADILFEDRG